MSKTAVNKSKIQCTLGSSIQNIQVTSQDFLKVENELIATEADKEAILNIPSFGNCKRAWYNPKCIPSPIKWTQLSEHNTIEGLQTLTVNSICKCNQGGEISFIDTANNIHVDSQ